MFSTTVTRCTPPQPLVLRARLELSPRTRQITYKSKLCHWSWCCVHDWSWRFEHGKCCRDGAADTG